MFRVAVLLALVSVLLTALALISCLSVEDNRTIRGMPRVAWVLAILLVPLAGAIGWFLAGRPRPPGAPAAGWPGGGVLPAPPHTSAPDDDPDFLRSLEQRGRGGDEERLRQQWEEDHRRREEERRRRDLGTDG
jgi:hypothetical protein